MNLLFWMIIIFTAAILFYTKWQLESADRTACREAVKEEAMRRNTARQALAAYDQRRRSFSEASYFYTVGPAKEEEEEPLEVFDFVPAEPCEIYNIKGERVA
mgnify:CR=1 FL=1